MVYLVKCIHLGEYQCSCGFIVFFVRFWFSYPNAKDSPFEKTSDVIEITHTSVIIQFSCPIYFVLLDMFLCKRSNWWELVSFSVISVTITYCIEESLPKQVYSSRWRCRRRGDGGKEKDKLAFKKTLQWCCLRANWGQRLRSEEADRVWRKETVDRGYDQQAALCCISPHCRASAHKLWRERQRVWKWMEARRSTIVFCPLRDDLLRSSVPQQRSSKIPSDDEGRL